MAWIGVVDEDSGMVKPAASYGYNEGYLDDIRITIREEAEGFGPTGSAIREGGLIVCGDMMDDPRLAPWRAEARMRGYRSSAAIALKLNDKAIGAFTMYAGEKDFFRGQLADLLPQLAMDISFALDNPEREAHSRAAERALKEETLERPVSWNLSMRKIRCSYSRAGWRQWGR